MTKMTYRGRIEKGEMDLIVPWKSQEEWNKVGELVYSNDIEKWKKVYEVLRSWKSRCLKLPAGAECTIIILEALLVEDEMKRLPEPQRCNVLPSCYAMALTRFLNLASSFKKERTYFTLYRIARNLNLPEWIVNLRHQSSHGYELPSLLVLKTGVSLALDWLDTEYWKIGPTWKNLCSSNSDLAKFKGRLSTLVAAYQEVMKLKICADATCMEEDEFKLDYIMESCVCSRGDEWLFDGCSYKETAENIPRNMKSCLSFTVCKLLALLIAAENRSLDVELLLDQFLSESLFLPTEDKLNLYSDDLEKNILPREMIVLWSPFLEDVILKAGALPSLIEKLVKFKSRHEMPEKWASVWVKYLARFLKSAHDTKRTLALKKKKGIIKNNHTKKKDIFSKRQEDLELVNSVTFDGHFLPEKCVFNTLIEDVINNPRRSTLVYIRDLLKLYGKPITGEKADMLVKAIEIQLQTIEDSDLMEVACGPVKADEIEEFCLNMMSKATTDVNESKIDDESECTDSLNSWENLPLGVYPGYYEYFIGKRPMLEFENDVEYISE